MCVMFVRMRASMSECAHVTVREGSATHTHPHPHTPTASGLDDVDGHSVVRCELRERFAQALLRLVRLRERQRRPTCPDPDLWRGEAWVGVVWCGVVLGSRVCGTVCFVRETGQVTHWR